MDSYNRAYRDKKSPLTPLTPLSTRNVFEFNEGSAGFGKFTPSNPKRNATHFLQRRDVFEEHMEERLKAIERSTAGSSRQGSSRSIRRGTNSSSPPSNSLLRVSDSRQPSSSHGSTRQRTSSSSRLSNLLSVPSENFRSSSSSGSTRQATSSKSQQRQLLLVPSEYQRSASLSPSDYRRGSSSGAIQKSSSPSRRSLPSLLAENQSTCNKYQTCSQRMATKTCHCDCHKSAPKPEPYGQAGTACGIILKHCVMAAAKIYMELPSSNAKQPQRQFQQLSPMNKPSLSPRTGDMLDKFGLGKYKDLFEREEIDADVFCTLTKKDLQTMGIKSAKEQNALLDAIEWAFDYMKL